MSKDKDKQNHIINTFLKKNRESELSNVDKKQSEKEISTFIKVAQYFEADHLLKERKQRKVAFILCGIFAVLCIVTTIVSVITLGMKKVDAFVIRVDNSTGYSDIVRVASENEETYGEVLDKYWLAQFVRNWESYDWESVQNMSDTIQLMSTPELFQRYSNYINDKKNSPMYLLKDTKSLVAKIKSVTFIETANTNLAQVRFMRYVRNTDGTIDTQYVPTSWITTITYDYKKQLFTEGERRINPLGFRVTSYSVASEKVVTQ